MTKGQGTKLQKTEQFEKMPVDSVYDVLSKTKFDIKKDLVREYLELVSDTDLVDYETLYKLACDQFEDWNTENKNKVIRWLKQYVYQIKKIEFEGTSGPKAKNTHIQQIGHELLNDLKNKMSTCVKNEENMYFLLNRFVWVRLRQYEDNLKKNLKKELAEDTGLLCIQCEKKFRQMNKLHLHRLDYLKAYSIDNCELLCQSCHTEMHRT